LQQQQQQQQQQQGWQQQLLPRERVQTCSSVLLGMCGNLKWARGIASCFQHMRSGAYVHAELQLQLCAMLCRDGAPVSSIEAGPPHARLPWIASLLKLSA
jgi:hypothetical protein